VTLEDRVMLSGTAPELPGLHLVNPDMKIIPMLGREWTEPEKAWIKPHLANTMYKPFKVEEVLQAVRDAVAAQGKSD